MKTATSHNTTLTSPVRKVVAQEGEIVITLKNRPQLPQAFDSYKDNATGKVVYYEINGNRERITISGTKVLRQGNEFDEPLIRFMVGGTNPVTKVKESGFVNSNAWMHYKDALSIENRVNDATIKNKIRRTRGLAEKAIAEVIEAKRERDLGYLFDIFSNFQNNTMHEEVLKAEIYNIVDKRPDDILKMLDNQDIELWLVLKKGLFYKMFKTENSIFYYNQAPMGISQEICIEWLKTNNDVYATLKGELDKLD